MEIPGYAIEPEEQSLLGEGGFAKVYLARHKGLQINVALKVMDTKMTSDPDFSKRFLREGRFNAELGHHPSIVTIHDIGCVDDNFYIAMQYLPGMNLQEVLLSERKLNHPLIMLRPIVEALGFAHSSGFVHRDIKPANILFDNFGKAVLSDFGIAKSLNQNTQLTAINVAIGTPHYMSPEQAKGLQQIDGRSDLYSIGVILYEMFSGHKPFDGADSMGIMLQHVNDEPPALPESESEYQPLIHKLLEKSPDSRHQSAEELIADIDRLLAGDTLAPPTRSGKKFSKRTAGIAAAIGGVGLLGVVGFTAMQMLGDSGTSGSDASGGIVEPDNEPVEGPADTGTALVAVATPTPSTAATGATVSGATGTASAPSGAVGLAITVTAGNPNAEKITSLLDDAQFHEDFESFVAPPGSNALEVYRQVLKLDPSNSQVKTRIQELEAL